MAFSHEKKLESVVAPDVKDEAKKELQVMDIMDELDLSMDPGINLSTAFHQKSIGASLDIWLNRFKHARNHEITREQFVKEAWSILDFTRWYQRGLDKDSLGKLFDLYVLTQEKPTMKVAQYCHAFLNFHRENVWGEEDEAPLKCIIELLYSNLETFKKFKVRFLDRSAGKKFLQENLFDEDMYLLIFDLTRDETYKDLRVTYGLNLTLVYVEAGSVETLPLIDVRPQVEDGMVRAYFRDHQRECHFDLNFLETTVLALNKQVDQPEYFRIRTTEEIEKAIKKEMENVDHSEKAEDSDIEMIIKYMKKKLDKKKELSKKLDQVKAKPHGESAQIEADLKAEEAEINEIPYRIKHYLTSPSRLEEYSDENLRILCGLGSLPIEIIYGFLSISSEDIAKSITPSPQGRLRVNVALKKLRTRLVSLADEPRRKQRDNLDNMLAEIYLSDVEHDNFTLSSTFENMTEMACARFTASVNHLLRDGYIVTLQLKPTTYQIIETRFQGYKRTPKGATCVLSDDTLLSANAVTVNPLYRMYDVIVQVSPSMHGIVVTFVRSGIKVITSFGLDDLAGYPSFYNKMTTPRSIEAKDLTQFDATKGSERSHVGGAHVVTQRSRDAMLKGVFNHIHTPELFYLPVGSVLLFLGCHTDVSAKISVVERNGRLSDFTMGKPITNEKNENIFLSSGHFITPRGVDCNMLEMDKEQRVKPVKGHNEIVAYIAQKPGGRPRDYSVVVSEWKKKSKRDVRQSLVGFIVEKMDPEDLNNLESYINPVGLKGKNWTAVTKMIKRYTSSLKPFFYLRSTEAYADAEASGFMPFTIHFDGKHNVVNLFGESIADMKEFDKFTQDVYRVTDAAPNREYRQVILEKEQKARAQSSSSSTQDKMSDDDLATKHDLFRQVTSQLLTEKMDYKEKEGFLFNPVLICYQKRRQKILNDCIGKMKNCYIRSELETEMLQRYEPNAPRRQVTEDELKDFYNKKFVEDQMALRMDHSRAYRHKFKESIYKLAKNEMAKLKADLGPFMKEDKQYTEEFRRIQDQGSANFEKFLELEIKEREKRNAIESKQVSQMTDSKKHADETEKANYLAERKQVMVSMMKGSIKDMVLLITSQFETLGIKWSDDVSLKEIEEIYVDYLWALVEKKYQERQYQTLFGFFKSRKEIPINPTDLADETFDPKVEFVKLSKMKSPLHFDCALKQKKMYDWIIDPSVSEKADKYTAFAYSILGIAGREVSIKQIAESTAKRYPPKVRR